MSVLSDRSLGQRIEAYVTWVRELRQGGTPPTLVVDRGDPLAELGRELEQLSAEVNRRETEIRRLFELVQVLDTGVLLDDVLDRIFVAFRGVIPYQRMGCAFVSDDGAWVRAYWSKSELGGIHLEPGYEQPLAGSSLEAILQYGRPRIINDLEAYLAQKPQSDSTRRIVEEGGRSSLTCPLLLDGRPMGFLFFTSSEVRAYQAVHRSVFVQIASQVSNILAKSRMFGDMVAHNQTLLSRTHHLEIVAAHDPLTGVLNRRAILDRLAQALNAPERTSGVAVILADLDYFKAINDTYGHTAGDLALQEFVRRLKTRLRTGDSLGRYGGEEFLVILTGRSAADALAAAECLRAEIAEQPFVLAGLEVSVTSSCGVAVAAGPVSPAALIERVDRALYGAKAAGRNRCVLDESDSQDQAMPVC